jgi:hypothetical protein
VLAQSLILPGCLKRTLGKCQTSAGLVLRAKEIAHLHAGVIAWSREMNAAIGDFGPSQVLCRHGAIPDLD